MTGFERMSRALVEALRSHLARPKDRPQIPEGGIILWQAFLDLDAGRNFHPHGPCPISLAEIEAWVRLKRYPLQPRHVEVLQALDAEMVAHLYMLASGKRGPTKARNRQTMTPALFDARFIGG